MIVHFHVCNNCGKQTEIVDDQQIGFEFLFAIVDVRDSLKGRSFNPKLKSGTFCDRDCLIDYLKAKLDINGKINENQ